MESVADVENLCFSTEDKLFYATQTTLSLDDVGEIAAALKQKYPQVETLASSSICYATTNRQMALRSVTDRVDLVLVVGDPTSSNSNRLCEVALKRGVPAHLINGVKEIIPEWFLGVSTLALTAGASTPEALVQSCIQRLMEMGVAEVEEVVFTEENVVFQLPKSLTTVA